MWQSAYYSESIATHPPFGPIEGHKWFDQISNQWESQKNRFVVISFGKIQFLPPCIWISRSCGTASDLYFFLNFFKCFLYVLLMSASFLYDISLLNSHSSCDLPLLPSLLQKETLSITKITGKSLIHCIVQDTTHTEWPSKIFRWFVKLYYDRMVCTFPFLSYQRGKIPRYYLNSPLHNCTVQQLDPMFMLSV